jgi:hypothetical protein
MTNRREPINCSGLLNVVIFRENACKSELTSILKLFSVYTSFLLYNAAAQSQKLRFHSSSINY